MEVEGWRWQIGIRRIALSGWPFVAWQLFLSCSYSRVIPLTSLPVFCVFLCPSIFGTRAFSPWLASSRFVFRFPHPLYWRSTISGILGRVRILFLFPLFTVCRFYHLLSCRVIDVVFGEAIRPSKTTLHVIIKSCYFRSPHNVRVAHELRFTARTWRIGCGRCNATRVALSMNPSTTPTPSFVLFSASKHTHFDRYTPRSLPFFSHSDCFFFFSSVLLFCHVFLPR